MKCGQILAAEGKGTIGGGLPESSFAGVGLPRSARDVRKPAEASVAALLQVDRPEE